MLNLDTHILIFALEGRLNAREQKLLAENSWGISSIVLWEVDMLARRGRSNFDLRDSEFFRNINRLTIWPTDGWVCRRIRDLDFKSDPADEMIAATSLHHGVPLLTRDRRILASKVVPLAS